MTKIKDLWDIADRNKADGGIGIIRNYEAIKAALIEGVEYGGEEDDYDEIEFFLEFIGHHSEKKHFDRLMEIVELLKNNYPDLYVQLFKYSHDDLVIYWCYHKNAEKLAEVVQEFINHPVEGSDKYFDVVETLLSYGQNDLLYKLIDETIETLADEDEITEIGLEDLENYKVAIQESKYFADILNGSESALKNFLEIHENSGREIQEENFKALITTDEDAIQEIISDIKERSHVNKTLALFQRYAVAKNIPYAFAASYALRMDGYWQDNQEKGFDYFAIRSEVFSTFIKDNTSFLAFDSSESVAVLYLSYYVYDFLYENGIIDAATHHDFLMTAANLREYFYKRELSLLWRYNFVHDWEHPNSWTKEDWKAEKDFFEKFLSSNLNEYK